MTPVSKGTGVSKSEPDENPLIPNQKLRRIYTAMLEARQLDGHIAKLQRKLKPSQRFDSTFGQEACRVSTGLELRASDLISEAKPGPVTDLILGAKVSSLLKTFARKRTGARRSTSSTTQPEDRAQQLPAIEDPEERLRVVIGAALVLKTHKRGSVVLAYVRRRELGSSTWKKILTLAAKLELPMIFVVLPGSLDKKSSAQMLLSAKASACGVPGIPVDSTDAVALYRVAQEALGRTRGGDGPVLIECLPYRLHGQTTAHHDPLIQISKYLLDRRVCDQAWLDKVGKALQKQLK
ncbi:thiamine pyrophosphate-dependent enzyme [Edaphobacter bradus]|uniref:thiamine pyrophosphate-dependent enzyme n=1 Tax=Edaphobacter bradus TaxID=2259016 RepID=UPI0021E03BCA|nr:thiamine pyrophosphate-dependent enzyme [Edaphobacter bradus]